MSNLRQCGFSLIELMIGIAIVGILWAIGMPAYSTWLLNQQIRNRAESINSGLQIARAEAIKLNTTVEFVLTNSDVALGNVNTIIPSSTGKNWMIRQYRRVTDDYVFVQSADGEVGAKYATAVTTPASSIATFDGFGRVSANDDASVSLQQIDIDSSKLSADQSRNLRVLVSRGGNMRLCDPNVIAPDPRRCVW